MTLIDILNSHPEWDDPINGTDKNTVHDYINGFYEEAFAPYRDKEINLLEVGVFRGGSLALWQKYFVNGQIYGLDVVPVEALHPEFRDLPRVKFISQDAYSLEAANSLPYFDIIIDDGPHSLESMLDLLKYYLPKLRQGGLLVIEDVQDTSWFAELVRVLPPDLKDSYKAIDLRPNKNRYDDLMFVVYK